MSATRVSSVVSRATTTAPRSPPESAAEASSKLRRSGTCSSIWPLCAPPWRSVSATTRPSSGWRLSSSSGLPATSPARSKSRRKAGLAEETRPSGPTTSTPSDMLARIDCRWSRSLRTTANCASAVSARRFRERDSRASCSPSASSTRRAWPLPSWPPRAVSRASGRTRRRSIHQAKTRTPAPAPPKARARAADRASKASSRSAPPGPPGPPRPLWMRPGSSSQSSAPAASAVASAGQKGVRRSRGRIRRGSRPQPVAHPDHGLDAFCLGAELAAQATDVGVHGAAVDVLGIAPDVGEELAAGLHPAAALEQQAEQPELGGGEGHLPAAHPQQVARDVELDAADLDPLEDALLLLEAAQHRLDPQHHLARAERRADVVGGAQLDADDAVQLLAAGGDHDDRQPAGERIALEHPRQLEAVDAGQHQVEQDEVRVVAADGVDAGVAAARGLDVEALLLEVVLQDLGDVRLILDHQDLLACHEPEG